MANILGKKKKRKWMEQLEEEEKRLKIIPLGGLNEIGKNMTVFEYDQDIIVVDCGIAFPDDEMLGVDLVVPDITYLEKNKAKLRGIVITHGHEDHIGAIPYVIGALDCPIYATRLTTGIIQTRLSEHKIPVKIRLNRVSAGQKIKLGCFDIEFIHVNHSIADAVALAITTPVGVVIMTGDFKIDFTPIDGEMADLTRFGQLGKEGVRLLMSDSTNAVRPGFTISEQKVGENMSALFTGCDQRVIVATFASNVHRIQQIINIAVAHKRKVAVSGRSMENILGVAMELGYITIPENTLIDIQRIKEHPKNKLCIITTGSQGEPMSALYRMAHAAHKQVEISAGDKIIISASPVPGNEKTVFQLINELMKKGADVVYENVHTSGHACSEELKLMLALTRPQLFMPVHGEQRHMKAHAKIAAQIGLAQGDVFLPDVGIPLEITESSAKMGAPVPSGRVLVDGLGVGDVSAVVLRDRKHLSEDGLITVVIVLSAHDGQPVAGPDIVSRGFIYVKDAEELMEEMRRKAVDSLAHCRSQNITDWSTLKGVIKNDLANFLYKKTKRNPMIIPIIMEA